MVASGGGIVQFLALRTPCGEAVIDQAIFEEGVRLTLIGMGTAFALLVGMALIIAIVGWTVGPRSRWARQSDIVLSDDSDEHRGKALAAVAAVSALLEKDGERD